MSIVYNKCKFELIVFSCLLTILNKSTLGQLLAVYATVRHFRHNLKGHIFFLNTDHKPLTYVMSSTTERQTRHMAYIAEFTIDIR